MQQQKIRLFNPKDFLNRLYKDLQGQPDNRKFNLQEKWACEAFFIIPQCDSCLEIECGPVLNLAACASRKCQHIYLTDVSNDFLEQLTDEIQKVGENDLRSFWSQRFQLIAKIQETKKDQVQKRLKQRLTACFKCDLTKDHILGIQYLKKVNVITTSLAIQCVAKDQNDYKRIVKNMRKLLKSRGFLYMFGSLGETFYMVNQQKIPVFPLNEDLIIKTVVNLDFEVLFFNAQTHQNPQKQSENVSDKKGFFSVLAQSLV